MTVFILGLDGASLENIQDVMKRTYLPNFTKVLESGRAYNLRSVYPYVTAPAWTSIFSGVNPGKHGIFDQVELHKDSLNAPNLNNCDVPFLWDYLSWADKKVLVMGVQFIHPAPAVNGVFVTGRFSPRVFCFPEGIKKHFDLSGYDFAVYTDVRQMWKYIEKHGTRSLWERSIELLLRRIKASISLLDSATWDAVIFVDSQPDDLFHLCFTDKRMTDELFVALDNWLGELIRRLRKEDTMLILSDHGFSGVHSSFRLREWLHSKGYVEEKGRVRLRIVREFDRRASIVDNSFVGRRAHRFVTKELRAFSGLPRKPRSVNELLEHERKVGSKIVPFFYNEQFAWLRVLSRSDRDRQSTIDSLSKDIKDLERSGIVNNVFRTTDLYYGKHISKVPGDCLIEMSDGFLIMKKPATSRKLIVKPSVDKQGTHRLNGLLVFFGNFMPRLGSQPNVYDILPTVLEIMRIPYPEYIDGKPLLDAGSSFSSSIP